MCQRDHWDVGLEVETVVSIFWKLQKGGKLLIKYWDEGTILFPEN